MIYGYIDEFGTNSLEIEKEGVSSHFLLGCVLVHEDYVSDAKHKINVIRDSEFQGSEIKSSNVKKKQHDRRMRVLQKIMEINFSAFLLVVDKKEINGYGLSFKQVFYKYIHKILVSYLNSIHGKICFMADNIGSKEYRKTFMEYISRHIGQKDLFNPESKYEFADSADEDLIQMSDFITGSLAKYYDEKSAVTDASQFLQILAEKIHVRYWPDKIKDYLVEDKKYSDRYDPQIIQLSINLAQQRLKVLETDNREYSQCQIIVLRHLLLIQKISPSHFVQTSELKEKVRLSLGIMISDRTFRKEVIGRLRDNNVIIASSNSGGYKLPVNKADLIEFVNRYNSILQPMLHRLEKCREAILIYTQNSFDILDYEPYEKLKKIMNKANSFNDSK